MADYVSRATGNFTTLSTWRNIGTGTRAKQVVHSASTNTTTSNVYNADAQDHTVANTLVIEGVMMFCNRVNTTGTVDVVYSQDSGTTATRTVTVNASDLPAQQSWVFFKFSSTLTADGGTDYAVGIRGSSAGNATFYRDATAGNWSHIVVLNSSPASLVAGDVFWVVGELTGAGTGNDITVTMDSTATTDYGTGTDGAESNGMDIGKRGILEYGSSASTNYYLKLSGSLAVWGDGTLRMGTVATPIPRTSTAVLEFDPVADGGMGLRIAGGGTFVSQGLSRTSGKDIFYCLLNTDEASSQTVLGVDTDTGWLSGDNIAIAPTGATYSEYELRTLSGNANASDMTVSSGLTNAHSGTSPTQAEVILLTRNVKVRSASSTIMSYVWVHATNVSIDCDWTEFRYLGQNSGNKRGFETDGVVNIQYCSFRDFEAWGMYCATTAVTSTIANNVFYNCNNTQSSGRVLNLNASQLGTYTATTNIIIGSAGSSAVGIYKANPLINTDYCRVTGINGNGIQEAMTNTASGDVYTRVMTGEIVHSCNGVGKSMSQYNFLSMDSCLFWRCTIGLQGGSLSNDVVILGRFINCRWFSNSTSDFDFASWQHIVQLFLENCELGSSTEITNQDKLKWDSIFKSSIRSTRHDQTDGNHKSYFRYGTIQSDSTISRTASPSERMTPNNASFKLESGSKKVAVESGQTVTINVYVRESEAGDGVAYNGARARLILKANPAMGISSDTVIDTATASSDGAFELLTGTTASVARDGVLEFVVDGDGTAGWLNVDDWSAS